MHADSACTMSPLNQPPRKGWRLSPPQVYTQGKGTQDRLILTLVVCQVIFPRNMPLVCTACTREVAEPPASESNTRTRCARVWSQSDSCGPLVRRSKYLRVPPNYLTCYTAEAQRISPTYSGMIETYARGPAKDRPTGSCDGRPDNG